MPASTPRMPTYQGLLYLILNSVYFRKVFCRWGMGFTTLLQRDSHPDLLQGSLGWHVNWGNAGRREEPPLQWCPGRRAAPVPSMRFSPNFSRWFIKHGRVTCSRCGLRKVLLEITKPAPPGCGQPRAFEAERGHGAPGTPNGPAGEVRCRPSGARP